MRFRGSSAVGQVRINQYVRINVLRLFYIKKLYPFTLASNASDIAGPNIDSVQVISIMGMHKVRIKIGDEIRIWMIDSGASDLLIPDKSATELKAKKLFSELDFIGEGQYVLADSRLITCKSYKIDGLQIGNFKVNNVI